MTPIVGLFLVALVEVALAIVVWVRNPGRAVNRWFAAFAMTLAVWGTLVGVRRSLVDPVMVLAVVRVLWATAALVPVTFAHFAVVFPRPSARRPALAQVVTFLGLFMSGLSFSPWIVADVRLEEANYLQPVYGPAFRLLGAYMILCSTWALAHLAGKLRHTTGFARAQLHYVFLGAGLTAVGALTLGVVVPLVTGSSRLGVYGPYFTLLWLGFTAHSIVRHRLMDVRVVISRSAAYAAGWLLTAALLIGGEILAGRALPRGEPDALAGRRGGAGPGRLRPVPRVRAAHAPSRRPVPVPARLRRARPRPRGEPGDGHLRRPRAGGDRHGGPDRPGPPPREPRHPRPDPGPRRLCAPRGPARRPGRRVARRAGVRDQPARPGAVGRDGRARPGSRRGSARQRGPGQPCCRTSGPGAPRRRCRSGTAA